MNTRKENVGWSFTCVFAAIVSGWMFYQIGWDKGRFSRSAWMEAVASYEHRGIVDKYHVDPEGPWPPEAWQEYWRMMEGESLLLQKERKELSKKDNPPDGIGFPGTLNR